ncbi:ubiquitin-associated and SH3 domain-containing protein B-like isoform X2 [Amphiura filiformis]|uniref:ubiquitin-associated and SH3 domain-containing protein B-like isoform X2 n=1 Tax=Amphiura filiformis TaxID=82378 RepID=UPI003B218ECC
MSAPVEPVGAAFAAAPPQLTERRARKFSAVLKAGSSIDILMSMGFPKLRVEKALAATGHQDVQLASDWLLNHCNDPTLDQHIPREYILYAVAVGPLGEALDEFWNQSLARCGRNGAHTLLPHVTLCQFFPVPDSKVEDITQALQATSDICSKDAPESITLERYSSPNFIGLFIEDSHAEYMRKFTQEFATQAFKHGGNKVEPHKKQLHLTLAYQFHAVHHDMLAELSDKIDINATARWEFRLYSRDPRSGKAEVLRVLYAHTPRADDELELVPDDYVFLPSNEVHNSSDGWFKGTSYLTGCQGVFPGNYTEKAPESDTWTVHRSIPLTRSRGGGPDVNLNQKVPTPPPPEGADEAGSIRYKNTAGLLTSEKDHQYDNIVRLQKMSQMRATINNGPVAKPEVTAEVSLPDPAPVDPVPKKPRRIYVIRHAERVDISFGQQWIQHCFDSSGKYQRKNLNMPKRVPHRTGSPGTFNRDSPITEMGQFQARLTGDAMKESGVRIAHVFSSPALRCVQTAHALIKGLDSAAPNVKIHIDTSIYEWLAWSRGVLPKWMTLAELTKFNLNVDPTYKELIKSTDLNLQESCQMYYKRSDAFVKHILKEYPEGDIVIVGHASSLDGCTRCLQGLSARQAVEFSKIVQKVPYCGAVTIEEYADLSIWDLVQPPFATLTHAPNGRFDWRIMQQ